MRVRATTVAVEKQNITYPEYVFAYLDIPHALRMHRTVMWPDRLCNIFPIISWTVRNSKKKKKKFFWT